MSIGQLNVNRLWIYDAANMRQNMARGNMLFPFRDRIVNECRSHILAVVCTIANIQALCLAATYQAARSYVLHKVTIGGQSKYVSL